MSNNCNVASFELTGFDHSPKAAQAAHRIALEFFATHGGPPDRAAIRGGGQHGRPAAFKAANAKLEKAGFSDLKFFEFEHEDDPAKPFCASAVYSGHRERMASIKIRLRASDGSAIERLGEPLRALATALGADFGWFLTNELDDDGDALDAAGIPRPASELDDWHNLIFTDDQSPAWRRGRMGLLRECNLVPPAVLDAPIEGVPLRTWIAAAPRRGAVEALSPTLFLWTVDAAHRVGVFRALWDAGLIFDPDADVADDEANGEIGAEDKTPRIVSKALVAKRKRLIAKIEKLRDKGEPLVTVHDFFDGNQDSHSLGANAADGARPSLEACHKILAEIDARENVQAVLVAIDETPDPSEPSDDELWPSSDMIYILTSARRGDVERWAATLGADETSELGEKWPG
ncbi:MAG TPA: hypothetical protein VFB32_05985, partial [Rudaea sp.]|nr:hypothetical protein [Rudaea sp.]